jgi:glycyl-tRNA synthetase beta chain
VGATDDLPSTDVGAIVSLADKLDHVAGAFVAGKVPTGSEDPYGVRRAGNGVIRILMDQDRSLDLYAASMESTRILFANDPNLPHAAIMKQLGSFWRGRVETALDERGLAYDERDAAVESRAEIAGQPRSGWTDPADCLRRARELRAFRGDARFESLVILFKRVGNILKASTESLPESLDGSRLVEPAERELHDSWQRVREATLPLWSRRAYPEILGALLEMEQPIHRFFDEVLVNAEDPRLRLNRLRLLEEVRSLFLRGWDLSRVVVEGERVPAVPLGR